MLLHESVARATGSREGETPGVAPRPTRPRDGGLVRTMRVPRSGAAAEIRRDQSGLDERVPQLHDRTRVRPIAVARRPTAAEFDRKTGAMTRYRLAGSSAILPSEQHSPRTMPGAVVAPCQPGPRMPAKPERLGAGEAARRRLVRGLLEGGRPRQVDALRRCRSSGPVGVQSVVPWPAPRGQEGWRFPWRPSQGDVSRGAVRGWRPTGSGGSPAPNRSQNGCRRRVARTRPTCQLLTLVRLPATKSALQARRHEDSQSSRMSSAGIVRIVGLRQCIPVRRTAAPAETPVLYSDEPHCGAGAGRRIASYTLNPS